MPRFNLDGPLKCKVSHFKNLRRLIFQALDPKFVLALEPRVLKVFETGDVDKASEAFTKAFNEVLEKHAPSRVIQNSIYYIPYISDKIREAIDKRDKLKNKAADTGDKTDFEAYMTERNKVILMLRNAKKTIMTKS